MLSPVCADDIIIVNACGGPCRERYSCCECTSLLSLLLSFLQFMLC